MIKQTIILFWWTITTHTAFAVDLQGARELTELLEALPPSYLSRPQKKGVFKEKGIFYGGDPTILTAEIKDIILQHEKTYDRIKVVFEPSKRIAPHLSKEYLPYFEASISSQITLTVHGKTLLTTRPAQKTAFQNALKHSHLLQQLQIFPHPYESKLLLLFQTKTAVFLETHITYNPPQIILDIKKRIIP